MKIAALNAQLPAFVHDTSTLPLTQRAPLMAALAKARGWDVVCLQEVDAAALNTICQAFSAGWTSVIEPIGLNGFLLRTGIGVVLRDQTWKLDSYGQRQRTLALLTLQTTLGTVACGSSHFAAAGPDISEAQANVAKLAQCAQVRALLPASGPVILGLDFARADADDDETAWRAEGYELGDRIVGKGEPTPETVITRGLPVLARTVVPTGQACDHDAMEIEIGEQVNYLTGKDVSSAQGGWAASKSDVFTFIKTTEGKSYVSPTLQAQAASARAAGHVVGFYHFLWPVATSGSTATQAAWFVTNAAAQPGDLLVCDWESTKGGTAPAAETIAFLAEVRRLAPQCKVGLYVNASMWKGAPQSLRDAAVAKGGFLWLAEYAKSPSVTGWSFWQYADHAGTVNVDQNYVNATSLGYFRKWVRELVPAAAPVPVPTPIPTKPATPAPVPTPVSPLVAIVAGIRTEADQLAAYVTELRVTAAELEKQIPA